MERWCPSWWRCLQVTSCCQLRRKTVCVGNAEKQGLSRTSACGSSFSPKTLSGYLSSRGTLVKAKWVMWPVVANWAWRDGLKDTDTKTKKWTVYAAYVTFKHKWNSLQQFYVLFSERFHSSVVSPHCDSNQKNKRTGIQQLKTNAKEQVSIWLWFKAIYSPLHAPQCTVFVWVERGKGRGSVLFLESECG